MKQIIFSCVLAASVLLTQSACGKPAPVKLEQCQAYQPQGIENNAKRNGQQYEAQVIKISDGDTIHVRDPNGRKIKLRLAFIDAPEVEQAGGQDSRRQLTRLLMGQTVKVQVTDVDRYQRQVALVWQNGQDINAAQIAAGMAWHYEPIGRKQQTKLGYQYYHCLEQSAQAGKVGLWRGKEAIAPWQYRQQLRQP